ncbi:MAG: hypothetical protein KF757_10185 [Phycisphaeraceae bacterium]|nr:hypothetical protein [Phycisphaeraceae bacterium]MCW5763582.1 hypothetical protein [Phycisphaeraceae bacterium]
MRGLTGMVALGMLAGAAMGQSFEATVNSKASSAAFGADAVLATAGTLIGNYDADTNPTGTQTRPGLFGGSGNMPIPVTIDLETATEVDGSPAGGFVIDIDFEGLQFSIDGLTLDLLNGSVGATNLSATLLYDLFRTFSPTFIYPGGIPITVPLGQIGDVSRAEVAQVDAGVGVLTETEDPNVFGFTALLTAEISLTLSIGLPGSEPVETPIDGLPVALPLSGQIERLAGGTLRISIAVETQEAEVELPIEGFELPPFPIELPTLTEGVVANVILTLVAESLTLTTSFGLNLVAIAEQPTTSCPADFNGDGLVDFFDVSAFLAAFSASQPSADLNDDGVHDFFDVQIFLGQFSAGCGKS